MRGVIEMTKRKRVGLGLLGFFSALIFGVLVLGNSPLARPQLPYMPHNFAGAVGINGIYIGDVTYCAYSNSIHFEIINRSNYDFGFGQISKAYKYVRHEWVEIQYGYVFVRGVLHTIDSSETYHMEFSLDMFSYFRSASTISGYYMLLKPFYPLIYDEYLRHRRTDTTTTLWVPIIFYKAR